jgi:hypothetical protein
MSYLLAARAVQDHVARCYEDENSNNEAIKHKDLG